MGFFGRNNKQAAPETAPTVTTTIPAAVAAPASPNRGGAGESVYSENTKSQKTEKSDYHPDEDPIDEEDVSEAEIEDDHPKEWDEGGESHCGYSESVHETLMSVGGSIHGVVGDPSPAVETRMNTVANWFQEMSYTLRDFWRGQGNMSEDLKDVMNSVMQSESHEEGGEHEEDESPTPVDDSAAATTPAGTMA